MECSHRGDCEEDVKWWLENDTKTKRAIYSIPAEALRDELAEYGAWDEEELKNDRENRERILWIAASDIREELLENG